MFGYRTGHDGEGEEGGIAHATRTVAVRNEPISDSETPRQRPAALPTKTPAQRSNVSHKSTLTSVNQSDGVALTTDTLTQSEVSELDRTVPVRNVTSLNPT